MPSAEGPSAPLRESFRTDTAEGAEPALFNRAAAHEWDAFFVDARLRSVVGLALADNRSLRAGVAAVERARALYGISAAARWPEVQGTVAAGRERSGGSSSSSSSSSIEVSLGVTAWEIDLFDRLGSLKGAGLARFLEEQR